MTDKPDNPPEQANPPEPLPDDVGGEVTLDGTTYQIMPTAFRSHYQVMTADGKLLGLIEMVETTSGRTFTARVATGAGMTQSLMIKIADLASTTGTIK